MSTHGEIANLEHYWIASYSVPNEDTDDGRAFRLIPKWPLKS